MATLTLTDRDRQKLEEIAREIKAGNIWKKAYIVMYAGCGCSYCQYYNNLKYTDVLMAAKVAFLKKGTVVRQTADLCTEAVDLVKQFLET